ncbi:MAG: hypothetical protein IIA17_07985 [candidate division Zixibacteria bacterium]|nr:hypothetical protein [candidate division Zixibacteria bacterium]
MKKLIFITLILTLVLAMSAFASRTRVLTMGNNNTILVDDANIWQFPSRINDYPGLAIAEIATGDVAQFGIHWRYNDDNPWVLATYFDNMAPLQTDDLMNGTLVPFDFALLDNRRIHILYGRMMGGNAFGARFSLNQSSYDTTSGTPVSSIKESFSYYQITFGLSDAARTWDVAFNLGVGSWTDENDGLVEFNSNGYYDFGLEGRIFWTGIDWTRVPHAKLMLSKRGIEDFGGGNAAISANTFTSTMFELGLGQVYTPASNVEAVLDFGFMFSSVKHKFEDIVTPTNDIERTDKIKTIPFFKLGLDAEVFRWMDVRFGATSNWNRETDDESTIGAAIEYKSNVARNATYLGFGFHWGNFHVDTNADPQLFLEGLNFISGGDETMNFQISAIYEML